MGNIRAIQREILHAVFAQGDTPEETRKCITDELKRKGCIGPALSETWTALLAHADPMVANLARQEIRVNYARSALAKSAERFKESPTPVAVSPAPPEESEERPAAPAAQSIQPIDEAIVNAWLDELGVTLHPRVASLSIEERDTLARIASMNRQSARRLVTHRSFATIVELPQFLVQARSFIEHGIHGWIKLLSDDGVFHPNASKFMPNLALFHYASFMAPVASRGNIPMQLGTLYDGVKWDLLPQKTRNSLQRRLAGYLDGRPVSYACMVDQVLLDVVLRDNIVSRALYNGRERVAFGPLQPTDDPVTFVRRQLLVYQLLAVAADIGAHSVDVMLYGNREVDASWLREALKAAGEMGIGLAVRQMDLRANRPRLIGGEIMALKSVPGFALRASLPPLRAPRENRIPVVAMGDDEGNGSESSQSVRPPSPISFASLFEQSFGGSEAISDWALALDEARKGNDLPASVRRIIREVLDGELRTAEAGAALNALHRVLTDEIESAFSAMDDLDDRIERMERESELLGAAASAEELDNARATIERWSSTLFEAMKFCDDFVFIWECVEKIAGLVHPDQRVAGPKSLGDTYFQDAEPLSQRIAALAEDVPLLLQKLQTRRRDLASESLLMETARLIDKADECLQEEARELSERRMKASQIFEQLRSVETDSDQGISLYFSLLPRLHEISHVSPGASSHAHNLKEAAWKIQEGISGLEDADPHKARLIALSDELKARIGEVDASSSRAFEFNRWVDAEKRVLTAQARRLEQRLPVPDDVTLPLPVTGDALRNNEIEGRGTLHFKSSIPVMDEMQRSRRNLMEIVDHSRALIVGDRIFLVDERAAKEIGRWQKERVQRIRGIDLTGRAYEINGNYYGVHAFDVRNLPEGHGLKRCRELYESMTEITEIGVDFIYTLVRLRNEAGVGEMLGTVLASALESSDFQKIPPDEEGDFSISRMFKNVALQMIAVALYRRLESLPALSPALTRWFKWGDVLDMLHVEYAPAADSSLDRLDAMSVDEMTELIQGLGFLPEGESDFQSRVARWHKSWSSFCSGWSAKCANEADPMPTRELKRAGRYRQWPRPYLMARLIAHEAELYGGLLLTMRFLKLEEKAWEEMEATGVRWDAHAMSRFATKFIVEHQEVLAQSLKIVLEETLMEVFGEGEGPSAFERVEEKLLADERMHGFDAGYLFALGKGYLERYVNKELARLISRPAMLIFGRFVAHEDDLAVEQMISLVRSDLVRISRTPASEISADKAGQERMILYSLSEILFEFWTHGSGLLDLPPAVSETTSAFVRTYSRESNGGGDEGEGGTSPADAGAMGDGSASPAEAGDAMADASSVFEGDEMLFEMGMQTPLIGASCFVG